MSSKITIEQMMERFTALQEELTTLKRKSTTTTDDEVTAPHPRTDMTFYKTIPPFDGSGDHPQADMESWLKSMNWFIEEDATGLSAGKLAQLATGKLLGQARQIATIGDEPCKSYAEITERLKERWGKEVTAVGTHFDLLNLRVKTSMAEYTQRFDIILARLKETVNDSTTIFLFLANLPDSIRVRLMDDYAQQRLTTLQSVQTSAVTLYDQRSSTMTGDQSSQSTTITVEAAAALFAAQTQAHRNGNGCSNKKQKKEHPTGKHCAHHNVDSHDTSECRAKEFHSDKIKAELGYNVDANPDASKFKDVRPTDRRLATADGQLTPLAGEGTFCTNLPNGVSLNIPRALLAPQLRSTLVSTAELADNDIVTLFDKEESILLRRDAALTAFLKAHPELIVARNARAGNTYPIELVNATSTLDFPEVPGRPPDRALATFVHLQRTDAQRWHERLGHPSNLAMKHLHRHTSDGPVFTDAYLNSSHRCSGCVFGKAHASPYGGNNRVPPQRVFEYVSSDIDVLPSPTFDGFKYFVTFVDHYSRYAYTVLLKTRDGPAVSAAYEQYLAEIVLRHPTAVRQVGTLRTDRGGEYVNDEFRTFLSSLLTCHETTIPNSSSQNGIAERFNRSIMDIVRSLLFGTTHSLGPDVKGFWGYALRHAVLLYNLRLHSYTGTAPAARFYPTLQPRVQQLRIFGCLAFHHHVATVTNSHKLDPRGIPCSFLGYPATSKGITLYNPATRKVFDTRNVTFAEDDYRLEDILAASPGMTTVEIAATLQSPDNPDEQLDLEADADLPRTYADAVHKNNPERFQWLAAVASELAAHKLNGTWHCSLQPPNTHTITARWVFARKRNAAGQVIRHKARLVARGFTQRAGLEYSDTFSPVVRIQTLRLLLSLALSLGLAVHQMDVVTAFLNGHLKEDIYMRPFDGLDGVPPRNVLKLDRALYGLKQAGREWHLRLRAALLAKGYSVSVADPSLFYRHSSSGTVTILGVYVDDIVVVADPHLIEGVKVELASEFKMTDAGEIDFLLGIKVTRTREGFTLSQRTYATSLVERFLPKGDRTVYQTPVAAKETSRDDDDAPCQPDQPYRKAVCSLMYLMTATRPDLAYAVSIVARNLESPTQRHWRRVLRILQYLRNTVDMAIHYTATQSTSLRMITPKPQTHDSPSRVDHARAIYGFTDSDWANDEATRRSRTGYAFFLGLADDGTTSCVSWCSKLQHTPALSSTEAEYMAASQAAREALWYRILLQELGIHLDGPSEILADNQSAIKLTENPIHHARTKHIDVQHHFVRDAVERKAVKLRYVSTDNNTADIFTKALDKHKFLQHRAALGLHAIAAR